MNVLLLNYEYPPVGGGGGVASKRIAEGLSASRMDVHVVTSKMPDLDAREVVNGVDVRRVGVRRRDLSTASIPSMLLYPPAGFREAARICRQKDIDHINSHFAVPSGILGAVLSAVLDIPHTVSIHGGDIYDPTKRVSPHRNPLLRYTVSSVLRRADNVVAQSSDIRRKAATYYGISEEHIDIIPLPYEQASFQAVEKTDLGLSEDMSTLVSVGRMVERKGYEFLLQAMVEIDGVELVLVGEGPKRDQLMRLADRLDIQERVHFPGYVSEERKFQYLAASSVYVLSSLHEGFGIVVQEALQVGLPVVATDSGGQTDIIEDGVHGRIVETRSVDALVDGIQSVLTSETEYEDRCKQRLEAYRPDRICRQYARLFDSTEV